MNWWLESLTEAWVRDCLQELQQLTGNCTIHPVSSDIVKHLHILRKDKALQSYLMKYPRALLSIPRDMLVSIILWRSHMDEKPSTALSQDGKSHMRCSTIECFTKKSELSGNNRGRVKGGSKQMKKQLHGHVHIISALGSWDKSSKSSRSASATQWIQNQCRFHGTLKRKALGLDVEFSSWIHI